MTTINAERGDRLVHHKGVILINRQSDWPTAQWRIGTPRYIFINKEWRRGDTGDWTLGVSKARRPNARLVEAVDWFRARTQVAGFTVHLNRRKENDADPAKTLRQRLDNANNHFRKKAAAVFGDGDAVRLLARLYQAVTVDLADFDACKDGVSLAKLTAANFCEIGAKSIYITEAGQNFIDAINSDE